MESRHQRTGGRAVHPVRFMVSAISSPRSGVPQRSPPLLLTTAACGGLRSTPDCRPRRALLHLSYSCASPFGPAILVTHDPLRPFCLTGTGYREAYNTGGVPPTIPSTPQGTLRLRSGVPSAGAFLYQSGTAAYEGSSSARAYSDFHCLRTNMEFVQ